MSAAELNEFLAAMEIVRQANAVLLDVATSDFDGGDDLDESAGFADLCIPSTIH